MALVRDPSNPRSPIFDLSVGWNLAGRSISALTSVNYIANIYKDVASTPARLSLTVIRERWYAVVSLRLFVRISPGTSGSLSNASGIPHPDDATSS